jgi:2-phosphoglycerate kinase
VIYLIGGPARCGKSTLAARVRKEIDGHVLAGDAFVHALQSNLEPEWVPDIFDHAIADVSIAASPEAKINRLRRRDETMWQFYESYIQTAIDDAPTDDILIEGNIWPDFLELFELEHSAVFLIDTSPQQYERLANIRNSDSDNNWMQDFSDEKLREWAMFNAKRSERYAELCRKHDYTFFDIATLGTDEAERAAFSYLLKKAV